MDSGLFYCDVKTEGALGFISFLLWLEKSAINLLAYKNTN